ncbi:alpha/beta fold hydrolase [Cupriavidus basilensis]
MTGAGGCRVVWRRFGEGRPVILLHGGHGSWLHWVRNIEALAAATHGLGAGHARLWRVG